MKRDCYLIWILYLIEMRPRLFPIIWSDLQWVHVTIIVKYTYQTVYILLSQTQDISYSHQQNLHTLFCKKSTEATLFQKDGGNINTMESWFISDLEKHNPKCNDTERWKSSYPLGFGSWQQNLYDTRHSGSILQTYLGTWGINSKTTYGLLLLSHQTLEAHTLPSHLQNKVQRQC